ncbi:MAG: hypothetical protein C0613_03190 [Desulfobulbaceae bacterium]|nr:MAG: hypothetical protein C0613_03190 [Desulfobulbaceae bacterium]
MGSPKGRNFKDPEAKEVPVLKQVISECRRLAYLFEIKGCEKISAPCKKHPWSAGIYALSESPLRFAYLRALFFRMTR